MLSIIIPTYNEKSNIAPLLREIKSALAGLTEYEVIFVDDSTDETPWEIERLGRIYGGVICRHRTGEKGLASAVVCGFSLASGEVIAVMDADLQHPPALLATLYRAVVQGADIVLPSRYIAGGQDEGLNFFRKPLSAIANLMGRVWLKSLRQVSDPNSGFFMLRRRVVAAAPLRPLGWKILMEILVMGDYSRVVEVPYTFQKRRAEVSKISLKVTLLYFLHIFSLILRSERERRFYLFVLVGLSGVAVDMAVYHQLSARWLLHVNLAATGSAFCAMLSNYLLNRNLTWKKDAGRKGSARGAVQFLKYAGVNTTSILIKNLGLTLLYLSGFAGGLAANFLSITAASLFNYLLNDQWVFKSTRKRIRHEIFHQASPVKGDGYEQAKA